jgi:two-component system, NtrC family, response regulator GlrR
MTNHKARILMVDDEPAILISYNAILQAQGYDVDCASTAREACAMLGKNAYDLVISDLSLEEREGGLKVLIRARETDPEIPALLLTGHADLELPERVNKNGLQILFKPVNVESLLSTIDFLVRGRKLRQPPPPGEQRRKID